MSVTDVHADDFGESFHASCDILDCVKAEKLDSISVLSNMSCFEKCVKLYRETEADFPRKPLLSVHVNFMEGKSLADPSAVPELVDDEGHFKNSWMKLFFRSFLPGRRRLLEQLKLELKLQTDRVVSAFPELGPLRIDSHQHTHMIPVVADALFEAIEENHWKVSYIRDAKEPLVPFLKKPSLYATYRPVNLVKNLILNFCSFLMKGRLKKAGVKPMYLWGLIMSGRMDEKRVACLLPSMKKKASGRGRTLEILYHPGRVLKEEITDEFSQEDAIAFHVSENRETEKKAVMGFYG